MNTNNNLAYFSTDYFSPLAKKMLYENDEALEAQAGSSWWENFFQLDEDSRNELLNKANIGHIMREAIASANKNFIKDPQAGIDLFKRLCEDSNPLVQEQALNLLENDSSLLEYEYLVELLSDELFIRFVNFSLSCNGSNQIKLILNSNKLFCRLFFKELHGKDLFTLVEDSSITFSLENELKEAKKNFDDDVLNTYRALVNFIYRINKAPQMESIDRNFQLLIDDKFPSAEKAKQHFDNDPYNQIQRQHFAKATTLFESQISATEKALTGNSMGKEILSLLEHLARINNDHELLSEIHCFSVSEYRKMEKIVVNVLDKMHLCLNQSLGGGNHIWIAPYFAKALKIAQIKLQEQKISKELEPIQEILKQCRIELQELSCWALREATTLQFQEADELIKKIKNLNLSESCLVPVTNKDHATLIRIEKTEEEKFRVLFYNTGLGVNEHHAEGKKEFTYQFIEYKEVPLKNLLNAEDWDSLITGKLTGMSLIYEMLIKICEGGIKQSPSQNQEYYDTAQKGKSCAYQCYLAMIRERLVTSVLNPAEGLALYKIVKGVLLHAFEDLTKDLSNPEVKALLQSKLKIVGMELGIANAVVDLKKKESIVDELMTELKAQNLEHIAAEVEKASSSPLQLFTVIRKVINTLVYLEVPLTQSGLITEAILLNREKVLLDNQKYKETLDNYLINLSSERIENWFSVFKCHFGRKAYQKNALEWAVKNLNKIPNGPKDKDPRAMLLNHLKNLLKNTPITPKKEEFLNVLIEAFKQVGKLEMVNYLETSSFSEEEDEDDNLVIL